METKVRTDQELFDTVARHLLKQGRKSKKGVSCMYRGEDGAMCAIGVLIPDRAFEEAGFNLERVNFVTDYSTQTKLVDSDDLLILADLAGIHESQFSLAQDLQQCHDDDPVVNWPICLRRIARDHELSDAVVEECKCH